jgi:hypothetical protein
MLLGLLVTFRELRIPVRVPDALLGLEVGCSVWPCCSSNRPRLSSGT